MGDETRELGSAVTGVTGVAVTGVTGATVTGVTAGEAKEKAKDDGAKPKVVAPPRSDSHASPSQHSGPTRLFAISRWLTAATTAVSITTFVFLWLAPMASPHVKAFMGAVLVLLISSVIIQHRNHRDIIHLKREWERASQLAGLHSAVIASFAMAIDAKDQHTHGHTERVCRLALMIAHELGLTEDEREALKTAAMLHDIGKLAIPDNILSKPAQLTREEMKKVETHTLVGVAILEPVQFPWPVVPIIRSHHEWYDGGGYPDGLSGEQICMGARILAVADVYDALLSHRPYRSAMTVKEAIALMREHSGSQFDPQILNTCFRILSSEQARSRFDFIYDAHSAELAQLGPDSAGRRAIFMDIQQAHQELLALYEIVQTMGQSLNVQETLDLIISKTKRIIDFATCVLFLVQPDDTQLVAVAAIGLHADELRGRRLPMGRGLSGATAQTGTPSGLGHSASDDLSLLLGPAARECPLTHALSAPVTGEGDSVGALTLYRTADRPFTEDDARLITAVARQAAMAINNACQYEQTRQSALTDQLTGLSNARYFFMHLEQELSRARRQQTPVSLIASDLDNLKRINDNFGHQQGDRALRILAEIFRCHVRDYDTVVRYAGDEFFIILPETTNQRALETANRIKLAVRETAVEMLPGRVVNLGASFGVATFPGDGKDADSLIAAADRAMYSDKRLNRQTRLLVAKTQNPDREAVESVSDASDR